MTIAAISKLKKIKKRRCIVVSCGGAQGGIQCLYFTTSGTSWEILAHSKITYPQRIISILDTFSSGSLDTLKPSDIGYLDFKVSQLMFECLKTTLAQVSRSNSTPHAVIINKMTLWKGLTDDAGQQRYWDVTAGDPQLIASTLGTPVFADFTRNSLIGGGTGSIPVNPGNQLILSKSPGISMLINIGVFSQLTIIDTSKGTVLVDSVTGPGTYLIDKLAKMIPGNESFDRDGNLASKGSVDGECLNTLVSSSWFTQSGPKVAATDQFDYILEHDALQSLSEFDKIATITALTARSIYNYYRAEYKENVTPDKIFISGGGANNLTMQEYLKAYFQSIPIKNIEELSIPADMRIPFALGLTVNTLISGSAVPCDSGVSPKITSIGRWYLP